MYCRVVIICTIKWWPSWVFNTFMCIIYIEGKRSVSKFESQFQPGCKTSINCSTGFFTPTWAKRQSDKNFEKNRPIYIFTTWSKFCRYDKIFLSNVICTHMEWRIQGAWGLLPHFIAKFIRFTNTFALIFPYCHFETRPSL